LITDEKRVAYIEDKKNPYSTPGRGKRQVTVNEGDMIAGYKLAKVNAESILLVHGEDKIIVTLSAQKERNPGEANVKATSPGTMPYSTSGQTPSTFQPQGRPMQPIPARPTQPNMPQQPPTLGRPTLNSR
jgi:hypothetical protein